MLRIKNIFILRSLVICIALFANGPQLVFSQLRTDSIIKKQAVDTTIILESIIIDAFQISSGIKTIPGSISVIVGDAITPSDGLNMASTLNSLPGLTMQSGTYATNRIVIRGMGSRTPYNTNRIKAYLNNIPITSPDGISTPEELELIGLGRIEVIKGPVSAIYGSGLGGTLNLYTPFSLMNKGLLLTQVGSFQTGKVAISGNLNVKNSSIWGALSHLESNGYRQNNQFKRTSILSSGQWESNKISVSYTMQLMDVTAGIPSSLGETLFIENPQAAAPNWLAINGYKSYSKALIGVTLFGRISNQITNRLSVFGNIIDSYEKRPFNNLDDFSNTIGIRNKLTYHTNKTDWAFGFEMIRSSYKWIIDLDNEIINKNNENRNQLNLFGLVNQRLSNKILLSFAISTNFISYSLTDQFLSDGDLSGKRIFPANISPRVGINYSPNSNWAIYSSIGNGFSMPSPEETLLPEGNINPNLLPEKGWQYEVGSRYTPSKGLFEFDFTLYWIELNNLLVTKRISEDIFTGVNAGKTRHKGFEIAIKNELINLKQFPGKISSRISYYTSLNRFISFSNDNIDHSGNKLPGIPNQTLNILLNWEPIEPFSINLNWHYHGDQYLNDENTEMYEGYNIFNAKATLKTIQKEKWEMVTYFGVNNLFDRHYASMIVPNAIGFNGNEPRYYYPGLPQNFYGGVRFNF